MLGGTRSSFLKNAQNFLAQPDSPPAFFEFLFLFFSYSFVSSPSPSLSFATFRTEDGPKESKAPKVDPKINQNCFQNRSQNQTKTNIRNNKNIIFQNYIQKHYKNHKHHATIIPQTNNHSKTSKNIIRKNN